MLGSMRSVRRSITRNQAANPELTPSLTCRCCRFGPEFSLGFTAKSMGMVAMCCPVKGLTFVFAIREIYRFRDGKSRSSDRLSEVVPSGNPPHS